MIYHKHLLVNATIKRPLTKTHEGEKFLADLVTTIEMKPLIRPIIRYVETEGNRGMTGAILIETSHISFHIWDEEKPAKIRFDLYTCGLLNEKLVLTYLERAFGMIEGDWMLLDREVSTLILAEGSF